MSYTRDFMAHCKGLVGLVGLEPTTSCSQSKRATKLRHSPIGGQGNSQPVLVTDDSYVETMELGVAVLERVGAYEELSRWEKSELGRDLRRLGLSYGEIMELIPVRKSTLATWCRDVRLTTYQVEAIRERRPSTVRGVPRDTQRKRHREVELLRAQATLEAVHFVEDPFWVAGVCMYWGEGSKTVRRLAMANADPAALRMFKRWSDQFFSPNEGWRARINLHADKMRPRLESGGHLRWASPWEISPRPLSNPTEPDIARITYHMASAHSYDARVPMHSSSQWLGSSSFKQSSAR